MNTFYHVVNVGIEKKLVFIDKKDLDRFVKLLDYYRFKNPPTRFSFRKRQTLRSEEAVVPLVHILCYIQMPDHFHLLLEETEQGNLGKFLSLVTNSYTKYFNARYKRSGPLFKGSFKRQAIVDTQELLAVSAYIHSEPAREGIVENLRKFPFSSFLEYIGLVKGFCQTDHILKHFPDLHSYQDAVIKSVSLKTTTTFLD